ncbi:hypothetical protein GcM3_107033, partial [Golovinomyces cichoracearum]
TLSDLRPTWKKIVKRSNITYSISPKKSTGRRPALTPELEDFVCSRFNRQMTYGKLANRLFQHWGVGEKSIKSVFKKRGYSRYLALRKPPISERNRLIRKSWAPSRVGTFVLNF